MNTSGQTGDQRLWNFPSKRIELLVIGGQHRSRLFGRSRNLDRWLLSLGGHQPGILLSGGDSLSNSDPGDCWRLGLKAQNQLQASGAAETARQLHRVATAHGLRRGTGWSASQRSMASRTSLMGHLPTSHSHGLTSDFSQGYSNCSMTILSTSC